MNKSRERRKRKKQKGNKTASELISVAGGSESHPVAGGLRLQMFLSRTVRRVISKFFDDTEVRIGG